MRKTIHAQIGARAISFPDRIEIQYQPVDEHGNRVDNSFYWAGPYTWQQVKFRFFLGEGYASECEQYFAKGSAALLQRARDIEIEGNWVDPGDSEYKEPSSSN
jgi:hypothetical protein